MTLKVEGLKELLAAIDGVKAKTDTKTLKKEGMKAMTPAKRAIQAAAPVGSVLHRTYKGNLVGPTFLRRGVRKRSRVDKQTGEISISIDLKPEAFYGKFLEEGFRDVAPKPWFWPAWNQIKDDVLRDFLSKLKANIRKGYSK